MSHDQSLRTTWRWSFHPSDKQVSEYVFKAESRSPWLLSPHTDMACIVSTLPQTPIFFYLSHTGSSKADLNSYKTNLTRRDFVCFWSVGPPNSFTGSRFQLSDKQRLDPWSDESHAVDNAGFWSWGGWEDSPSLTALLHRSLCCLAWYEETRVALQANSESHLLWQLPSRSWRWWWWTPLGIQVYTLPHSHPILLLSL